MCYHQYGVLWDQTTFNSVLDIVLTDISEPLQSHKQSYISFEVSFCALQHFQLFTSHLAQLNIKKMLLVALGYK